MRNCFKMLSLALVLALSGTAFAHENIVKIANPNPKKGEKIAAEILNTHVVIGESEETTPAEYLDVALIQDGKPTPAAVVEDAAANVTRIEGALPGNGAAWLAVHRKPILFSQTPEGMLEGDKDSLKGVKVLFTNKYEKFAKVLLNASESDGDASKPIGHLLEIVPQTHPSELRAGNDLAIKILYNGNPIALPVMASYDGFTTQNNAYAFYVSPDSPDDIRVKLHQPGFWVVVVHHKVPGQDGVRTHNLNAALEFEVK